MGFLADLLNNILADIIFWIGLGFIIIMAIRITQGKFLSFFGLQNKRKVIVYLSNLWQPTSDNLQGCVLSGHEFRVTRTINSLFGDTPFRLPELVRGLVDSFWIGKDLILSVEASPLASEKIEFTNMIVIGATPKNGVRRYYFRAGLPYLAIVGEQAESLENVFDQVLTSRVRVMKGQRKDEEMPGEYNFAIVERIRDDEHGTVVFMCAGFRGDSSWAATEYLARNWRELRKEYGDNDFAVCLGFPKSEEYMDAYVDPTVVARFPSG